MAKARHNNIKDRDLRNPGYSTFGQDAQSRTSAFSAYSTTMDSFNSVQRERAVGSNFSGLLNPVTDISIRQEFNRTDYDNYRPGEAIPTKFRDIVVYARNMYKRVGVIRNVIDLMTDFSADDVKFMHPDKEEQAFYQAWSNKIGLQETINQFARHLLIDHNVVVKRITARLSKPVEKEIREQHALAKPDIKVKTTPDSTESREIPWRYRFLDITNLTWIGGESGLLSGQRGLAFRLPSNLISMVKKAETSKSQLEKDIVENFPNDIIEGIKSGKQVIQLDNDKLYVTYCKKDDWDAWSVPFLYSVMPDIVFKDKLRQAEVSALDGVINVIRIWKLGDHKEGVLPNQAAINKLINILEANTGGGAMDIVWDSMIEMEDFYPPIDKILGSEKYDQVNKDILIGLGIPEVLLGGRGGNFSNSFIQLKTIVERLKYIRARITEWLLNEVALIAKAMGFATLPKVYFNQMSLNDENVEKQLIVGLLDRGIISPEGVLEAYGKNYDIELQRNTEQRREFKKKGLDIVGPYDPAPTPISGGGATPSGGRPPATKDVSRKTRKSKPRTAEDLAVIAHDVIDIFDEEIVPAYMEQEGLQNARQLTSDHKRKLAGLRIHVLACINDTEEVTSEKVVASITEAIDPDKQLLAYIKQVIATYVSKNGKEPTLNQRKTLEASAWATFKLGLCDEI